MTAVISTARPRRHLGQKKGTREFPSLMKALLRAGSSKPQTKHFFRNRTFLPSCPTRVAPLIATTRFCRSLGGVPFGAVEGIAGTVSFGAGAGTIGVCGTEVLSPADV